MSDIVSHLLAAVDTSPTKENNSVACQTPMQHILVCKQSYVQFLVCIAKTKAIVINKKVH
jgi:hypothetical protein